MRCDSVWTDARLATMSGAGLGIVEDGLVAARSGRIVYAGSRADAPRFEAEHVTTCEGRWITPGLVDCHTHLVHAGDRTAEYQKRLQGVSYAEIARAGGGILATMRATRAASEQELVLGALPRLDALLGEGVTTIEIKSGYGLELDAESRTLRTARRLALERRITVKATFLGAHTLPPEFAGRPDDYITELCERWLPALVAEDLVDAVDAFCENIAFTPAQVERLFGAAARLGLPMKLHAEQISNSHGAELAARFGALSADHLEHIDERGIAALAKSGTVATLLPGAYYVLRETKAPPVDALRAAGVAIALATDCNPGTSPMTSLLLAMNMGATLFRLTVEECLRGVTRHAARALGMSGEVGTLEAGMRCDLAIWNIERPEQLVFRLGLNPLHTRVWNGQ